MRAVPPLIELDPDAAAVGLAASAAVAHTAGHLSLATVLGNGARRLGHDDARSGIDQTRITGLLTDITTDTSAPERHVLLAALASLSSLELERR
jgi:hypothetical protein